MKNLLITYQDPQGLFCSSNTPREHSQKQIEQVARSIKEFGFINPIVLDQEDKVVAGAARLQASQQLGLKKIPIIKVEHLTDAQLRAYRLADNKLAENSTWNEESLRAELEFLSNIDIDFDVELTGFETAEIDYILCFEDTNSLEQKESDLPKPPSQPIVLPGDVFQIGPHRLICGDCRNSDVMYALMGNRQARMVITDPPYNVKTSGHVLVSNSNKHRDFAMASGEMSEVEFTQFLQDSFQQFHKHSLTGSIHIHFMDWRHMDEILRAGKSVYEGIINLCVWSKTNGGMGSLYRSGHELAFVFKKGEAPHINNVELGKHGRNRTNVWTYAGMNSFRADRDEALSMHPTVKPLDMISDAILDVSKRGDVVLDGFLGSGTTIMAAEKTGRIGYGVELDPAYVEVIIERFHRTHGIAAIHEDSDLSFEELKAEREAHEPEEELCHV